MRFDLTQTVSGTPEVSWMQARTAVIPGGVPRVVTTASATREGVHAFYDIYETWSEDGGATWSTPTVIPALKRHTLDDGYEKVIGDLWPSWHAATGTILGTGKSFFFPPEGRRDDVYRQEVAYTVWDPATEAWSAPSAVRMPEADRAGHPMMQTNAGCVQRRDLPDGNILLPFRYSRARDRRYVSAVMRCAFDGRTLSYLEHGTEFTVEPERGLYEPSVCEHGGRYYLTMRNDLGAFVARGDDGIHYEQMVEWSFDDGETLGSYNTQQHWISRPDALYLVYTRKGADNDHIMRHRAPLFIGRVDPDRLCVLRETERVLLPENNACFGNGGVVDYTHTETWVTEAERLVNDRQGESNSILIAKIHWS